jgi:hypothetical protein
MPNDVVGGILGKEEDGLACSNVNENGRVGVVPASQPEEEAFLEKWEIGVSEGLQAQVRGFVYNKSIREIVGFESIDRALTVRGIRSDARRHNSGRQMLDADALGHNDSSSDISSDSVQVRYLEEFARSTQPSLLEPSFKTLDHRKMTLKITRIKAP